ncbi:hypothetical protein AXF42_Ash012930 [Apostasia shenzhenica]|uniref:Secreted protein n=1 Tax=Apostasia shenzhenica TaxID=1088818 RepID=A0A2I0ARN3_9ASPA|nr:hypothetical protein AXF42_Ash012930 [Apostasia shenzhenica]
MDAKPLSLSLSSLLSLSPALAGMLSLARLFGAGRGSTEVHLRNPLFIGESADIGYLYEENGERRFRAFLLEILNI